MGSLKSQLPQLSQARAALARVEGIGMDLGAMAERGADRAVRPLTSFEQVELVNVTYLHRGQGEDPSFTLGPINLTFKPGELVFLGGGNGSGKTTFAKLLTGLYVPREGEIRLNGQTVRRAALERYRQLFTVIFSEFHLFSELHGLAAPDLEDKARTYLKLFQIDNRVSVTNGAFSTTTRLSGGQRKRLALVVAYLEDRPFYIFDEWAADQDPHFKEIFYTQLLPELKSRGKVVLAITHDDRYYHLADRLLLLEDGKLRCHGDPLVADPTTEPPPAVAVPVAEQSEPGAPEPTAPSPEVHPAAQQNGAAASQLPARIQVP
jgi:putative ATP-binding cassette transporter